MGNYPVGVMSIKCVNQGILQFIPSKTFAALLGYTQEELCYIMENGLLLRFVSSIVSLLVR